MRAFRRLFAVVALVALLVPGLAGAAPALATFTHGAVTIVTASGQHKFSVELALNEQQREQGLMFRASMPADAGMLFVYPSSQTMMFWMKNTLIPLDMLFIRSDGVIANIRERAVPESLETIPSAGDVRAALELNGGTVARLGIRPGDKVIGEGLGE